MSPSGGAGGAAAGTTALAGGGRQEGGKEAESVCAFYLRRLRVLSELGLRLHVLFVVALLGLHHHHRLLVLAPRRRAEEVGRSLWINKYIYLFYVTSSFY